jgi:hypothetical protein
MTGRRRSGPAIPMFEVTTTGWAATLAIIAGLLALDWYVLGRRPHVISLGEAARWSILYIAIALSFGVAFGLLNGWDLGGQYFAGYVVEESLSVDNLFVFVLIIGSFAVPAAQQPRALSIAIALAVAARRSSPPAQCCWSCSRSCSWSSALRCSPQQSSCFATATKILRSRTT